MGETAGRSGLPIEPLQHSRVRRICPVEHLHRDGASESFVDATPDGSPCPRAQHRLQQVATRYQLPVQDPHPDTRPSTRLVNLFNDKSWYRQLGQAGQRDIGIVEIVDIERAR
jgi:hypothetical protein